MALVSAKCLNCGKSIHVSRDDVSFTCPFCNSSVDTMKSIELYKTEKKQQRQTMSEYIIVALVEIIGILVFAYAFYFVASH